jgi:glycosyltransferase involved in cell wall biosynthesis
MIKKLSIAIPTWESYNNGEQFLDDLLRTIEIQTFKDFEVVISDHSKDDYLLPKIKEFEDKFDIKYYRNENDRGNSPANMNNAISKCSGEIVKIMFQDDFFYDDEALEKIYYALSDSDRMWLLNGTNHTKDDGNSFYWDLYPKFNDDLLKGVNTISSPSVVAFKRQSEVIFDETLVYFMDIDYYYGMHEKYGDPVFYNDILVTNRFPHKNSISSNITNKKEMMSDESKYCFQKYGVSE